MVRQLNAGILVSSAGTADMPHIPVRINVQPAGNVAASAVKRTTSQHSAVRIHYIP